MHAAYRREMSGHIKNRKGTGAFELLSFALLTIFFIGIGLLDGPEWCVDSPSYTSMDFSREPVYPLFLLGLRVLFEKLGATGEAYSLPAYLTFAMLIQSMVWVMAAYYLGNYIYEIAQKSFSEKRARILALTAELLQVAVAILNRFVAKRGSMYSESIMTESLAMPLFVIFTVVLVQSFDNYDVKAVLKLFFLSVLIASIRKQMLVALLTWGFVSFVMHLFVKRYRSLKKFSYTVIAVVVAFVAINLLDASYNLAVRGTFAGHIGNSKGGLDTVLYTASENYAVLFDESDKEKYPEITALFSSIMEECRKQELTIEFAPGMEGVENPTIFNTDWVAMVDHYAQCYDVIGFDVVLPICDEYVAEHFPELDGTAAQIKEDQVESELFKVLLKGHISNIISGEKDLSLYVLTSNIVKAFVMSNANISPRIFINISFAIYGIFVICFIIQAFRLKVLSEANGKKKSWVNTQLLEKVILFGFVVAVGLSINCVVTGALIFPQPRYMCYSMGLFYLSLILLVQTRQ